MDSIYNMHIAKGFFFMEGYAQNFLSEFPKYVFFFEDQESPKRLYTTDL